MTAPSVGNIREHVFARVASFSGERGEVEGRRMSEVFRDPWDFIELCEDLEQMFRIDLRPFFEEGQPARRWLTGKQKAARDVTVRELADHVEAAVRAGT
jgi:hypothetical protein